MRYIGTRSKEMKRRGDPPFCGSRKLSRSGASNLRRCGFIRRIHPATRSYFAASKRSIVERRNRTEVRRAQVMCLLRE